MGYRFKDQCFDTKQEFINAFAQSCGGSSGSGGLSSYFTICTANSDTVTVQAYSLANGTAQTPYAVTPQTINCDYVAPLGTADMIELSWLVVGVWVTAWGFKKMMEVIRK